MAATAEPDVAPAAGRERPGAPVRLPTSELLLDLEHYMNRHDLDLQHLTLGNHLSIVAHQSERTEPDGSTVYEYRGLDGMDIDVYELQLGGSMTLFFQKRVTTL